ncbi:MAG: sigma-70 family RNA polymerase sigma factor [Acidobacteriota bacterium]|nr:sigma-70 family RNA polymerase sigma factor [Acidobacteriota bacterium]
MKSSSYEDVVLPHLSAAYNLARWLTRNDHDAEDAVQEACLRALRSFEGFRGGDSRTWLLTIVRNTCYTSFKRAKEAPDRFDEEVHSAVEANPESLMLSETNSCLVKEALEALPMEFREVIVLREMEGQSYKEIASVTGIPIGTVMSRLARGRAALVRRLRQTMGEEPGRELLKK